ncbi:nicotinamide riboside transporter PnuC [Flavobacterium sp. MFBS3-15]|uniref:nicotinamide riboside transporter PnuC n=1 Tax=Flavobacterium sp. MFBS3-15 TaxID=2989816 RepID=UPI00278C34E4|nr:nicotinamide riboside transporter PnuC [Flavobacterium sp. MFBS3-15]
MMQEIADFLFGQFEGYTPLTLSLELTAIFFGLLSVIFSARNSILVYPTGIVSTVIFVYIFYVADLYGDIIINGYYFYMSVYGWALWARGNGGNHLKITSVTPKDNLTILLIFIISVIFVALVYYRADYFGVWWAYVDTFTTGLFFVGMWLLAKRKLENWIYLIIGDIIVTGVYFYKGLTFTGFFYIILTIIAIFGYFEWKRILHSEKQLQ